MFVFWDNVAEAEQDELPQQPCHLYWMVGTWDRGLPQASPHPLGGSKWVSNFR